jgi:hypothetical protein
MKELIAALIEAKKEIPAIKKSANNPFFNSAYAPLESVLETVEPILFKNGLVIVQTTSANALITTLYHASGTSISSEYPLPTGLDSQKLGAAVTYARRYAISALLSLATEPDDDGNMATKLGKKEASNKPHVPAKAALKKPAASDIDDDIF